MTISNTVRTAGPFVGNDVSTVFSFTFKIFKAMELLAVRTDVGTGIAQPLVLNLDYTVVLNPDQNLTPGGLVTISAALPVGQTLVLTSDLEYLQPIDITNAGGFYPSVINAALDRLTIFCQQLFSLASRSLKLPLSDTGLNTELPSAAARANKLLGFASDGSPVVTAPASGSSAELALALAGANGTSMIGFEGQNLSLYLKSATCLFVDKLADLRTINRAGMKRAYVAGYYSPGDGGGGFFYADLTDFASVDDGATIIVSSLGIRWKAADTRTMSVLQWGCRWNGTSDDTPRAQAALDYFIANGGQLRFPAKGTGWITALTARRSLYTVNLHNDGSYLEAISTAPQLGILNIVGCVNLFVTGAWRFNGGNRNNYQAALAIRVDPDTNQPTTRIKIYNVTVRNAPIGIANGQYNNDLQCSEIGIFGADFFQCPQPIYNGGSNSGMQLVGCDITSESNANFPGVVETAIYQEGGFLKVTGGSIVSNPLASYTITEAPCQSAQYSANLYGTLDVVGAHVETNAPLLNVQNPRAFATTDSSLSSFKFVGNTGFAGGDVSRDFIYVNDAQYKGLIEVLACNWYSVNPRGGFNMSGLSSGARFCADKNSFGLNFQNWLGGIGFGRAIHDMAPVTSVSGLGLTYLAGQPVVLKFQAKNVANELAKYGNQYNPVTGTFEVPVGGFSTLQITCNVAGQGTATAADLYLRRGGATVMYGTVSNRVGTLSATLHDLIAGEILDIVLLPTGGTFITDNGLYNSLQIVGETR